jgi:hypothetical protein
MMIEVSLYTVIFSIAGLISWGYICGRIDGKNHKKTHSFRFFHLRPTTRQYVVDSWTLKSIPKPFKNYCHVMPCPKPDCECRPPKDALQTQKNKV